MVRFLFNLVSDFSLLLCLAVVALWVRSYRVYDRLEKAGFAVASVEGFVSFERHDRRFGPPEWRLTSEEPVAYVTKYTAQMFRPTLRQFGVRQHRLDFPGEYFRALRLSYWLLAIVTAVPPLVRFGRAIFKRHRTRTRRRLGLCSHCGYDLRAAGDKCPECGNDAEKASDAAAGCSRIAARGP